MGREELQKAESFPFPPPVCHCGNPFFYKRRPEATLPGQTGSPEVARRRTRPLPLAGVEPAATSSSPDDLSAASSKSGAPVSVLLTSPEATARWVSSSSSATVAALSSTPPALPVSQAELDYIATRAREA